MNSIGDTHITTLDLESSRTLYSNSLLSRNARVDLAQQTIKDFSFVTSEGDRVTLSSSSSHQVTYAFYNQYGEINGISKRIQSEELELELLREFSVSIEGDLNPEELEDIRKAIQRIEQIFRELFRGNIEEAFGNAMKLGTFDTLESIEASLEYSSSVSLSQAVAATTTAQAQQSVQPISNLPDPISYAGARQAVGSVLDTIQQTAIHSDRMAHTLEKLVKKLLKELKEDFGQDNLKSHLMDLMLPKIENRMEARHLPETSEEATKDDDESPSESDDTHEDT